MKKILLSFKPYWHEKIKSGEKIFEYRKRFCDEPVMAYMSKQDYNDIRT